jgi:hypothetical protein
MARRRLLGHYFHFCFENLGAMALSELGNFWGFFFYASLYDIQHINSDEFEEVQVFCLCSCSSLRIPILTTDLTLHTSLRVFNLSVSPSFYSSLGSTDVF